MRPQPFTSGERRGILSVAIAALLCTGAGVAVRQCHSQYINSLSGSSQESSRSEAIRIDTIAVDSTSVKKASGEKKKSTKKTVPRKPKDHGKPVAPRNPLNELIPTG